MKKLFLCLILAFGMACANDADEVYDYGDWEGNALSPHGEFPPGDRLIKATISYKYDSYWQKNKPYLTITALEDLHVKEITVNRGNCSIGNVWHGTKNFDLKYGKSIEYDIYDDCDVISVEVHHSYGTAVANF